MTTKRLSISVSDWTYDALEEIATLQESSIANVVRDCLRGMLPKMLEIERFLHNPATTREETLRLADDIESLLGRITGDDAAVATGDVASRRPPTRTSSPPSSNTGANSTPED